MGRAVLTQTDGIMRKHPDAAQLHQRRHAQGIAGVIREGQEGAAKRDEATMQRKAVHDRRHAELAHTVEQIVAAVAAVRRQCLGARPPGQVGAGEIGRAAHQLGQCAGQTFDGILRGLAAGNGFGLAAHCLHEGCGMGSPGLGQLA